jgi:hypothetical protein
LHNARVEVDLVCPTCLHDAGRVEFDALACGTCPACGIALKVAANVMPVEGYADPPPRQLALRAERPRRSKMRTRRDGERLITWQRSWLLFLFMKRVELGPDGYTVRTWRKTGSTQMLSDMRGFVMLQRCLAMTSPVHLMWVSHAVWRGVDGGDLYGPLYAHGSYEDGAYYCSLLNAHLATLQRGGDPYR